MALTIDYAPVLDAADLYRRADRDLQRDMRRTISREINPWLKSAIRRNARDTQSRTIAATARVRSGTRPAVVVGSPKKFPGGASTAELAPVYEFGGYQNHRGSYRRRSPRTGSHLVTRRTQRQIPRTDRSGRFIYPAVADAAPMLVRAWVEAIAEGYTGDRNG